MGRLIFKLNCIPRPSVEESLVAVKEIGKCQVAQLIADQPVIVKLALLIMD